MVIQYRRDAAAFDRELVGAGAVQLAVLAALAGTLGLHGVGWLAGLLFTLTVGLLTGVCGAAARAAAAGPANRVTLARGTLIGGVAALAADGLVHGGLHGARLGVLVAMASVALVLDLVDGWVARRTGTVSELGARMDMELDALLVAVLSVLAAGTLGPWVLLIGLMRYLFVIAGHGRPWLTAPLPPSRTRKVVAAVQGVTLVVAVSLVVPHALVVAGVLAALAALLWSFGRDTLWLVAQPR
ncbi:MAG TPA: CDP-alcohol phosphatidyltransferase family protein [Pseudonocardia sp.]|nr:CDP-alcohol phosphatidyltransferase family protein [Pseudonocardia sp.]